MAVLNLLLQQNATAREIAELADAVTKHNPWTSGKRFMLVPFNLIGATGLEAALVGLGLIMVTKWLPWDPICGIFMAINILVSGGGLIRSASAGLMDHADPEAHRQLVEILDRETAQHGISYHALRHRNIGDAHWVELHFLFPEGTSLGDAHRAATAVEQVVERSLLPRAHVTSHLECTSDHDALHPGEAGSR
jgi:divalent metal cation (Fe/Co/Zn/Cd) transporter